MPYILAPGNPNSVQMDKQEKPEKSLHMERIQPGSKMGRMAHSENSGANESCWKRRLTSECIAEEPYKGKPFVQFREGGGE